MRHYLLDIRNGIDCMKANPPTSNEWGPTAESIMWEQVILLSQIVEDMIVDQTQKRYDE